MLQLVDSHVHFWNPDQLRYTWLDDLSDLNQTFSPVEYDDASEGVEIANFVFVQANCADHQATQEAKWVATLDERIRAIVAFAAMEQGESVRAHLDEYADMNYVKGIRRLIQSESAGFAVQSDFVKGVQILEQYDFSFDICVFHHQLPDVIELVRRCPNVQFVLDHGGKPAIQPKLMVPWHDHIRQLADFDNVYCKISGLVTEADHENWSLSDLKPYVDHLLNTFGTKRLMFGSDFPVLNLAGGLSRWITTFKTLLVDLSEDEKADIYHNNARSFYRIT